MLCKEDGIQNAILVFDEILRTGYTPNMTTYSAEIRGLCHVGEMGRVMEFVGRMWHEGCKPNVQSFNVVIRHWCEEGEPEKALKLLARMKEGDDCLPNLIAFNVVNCMFARKSSEEMVVARRMVMEMVECGPLLRRFMFNKVLNDLLLTVNQYFFRELLRIQDRFGRLRLEI